jgi:hypothetical protein
MTFFHSTSAIASSSLAESRRGSLRGSFYFYDRTTLTDIRAFFTKTKKTFLLAQPQNYYLLSLAIINFL